MRRLLALGCLLGLAMPVGAQSGNPRYNSIALGPATGQPAAAAGVIRLPNNGGIITTSTAGQCYTLWARDVDGATNVAMVTICAGNTPTIDLHSSVTIGGEALLPFADPGAFDAMFYLRNSDNTLQPVTIGGTCSFTGGTLSCTIPTTALVAASLGGALGGAGLALVLAAHGRRRRDRRLRDARGLGIEARWQSQVGAAR